MTPHVYIRRASATNASGEREDVETLMVEVRPHEAVNADFLGIPPDRQKRMKRDLEAKGI